MEIVSILKELQLYLNINRRQVVISKLDYIAELIKLSRNFLELKEVFKRLFEFDRSYYQIIRLNGANPASFFNSAKYILNIVYLNINTDYEHCKKIVFETQLKDDIKL